MSDARPPPTPRSWQAALLLLLHLLLLLVAADDLASDAAALQAFLSNLQTATRVTWPRSSSSNNSAAAVAADPCAWQGVVCSNGTSRRVQTLRLPGLGLTGTLAPSTLGRLSELRVLSLRANNLRGELPADLSQLPQLRSLYLQNNLFSGPLPSLAASALLIIRLDLAFNNFSASIPSSYAQFRRLGTLFLQNNSLSGPLPDSFNASALPNLSQLNLSFNALNGSLPLALQQKFTASSFAGNLFCGAPLFAPCASTPAPAPAPEVPAASSSSRARVSTGYIVAIAVGGAAAVAIVVACCVVGGVYCVRRQRRRKEETELEAAAEKGGAAAGGEGKGKGGMAEEELSSAAPEMEEGNKLVFFEGSMYRFDLEDLLRASAEVLGKGSGGTAYKAVLEDGATVVVKRLKDVALARKEFRQHMEALAAVRQRNLLPLRAFYFSKDEKLLLFDYMPLGSLSALLHGNKGANRPVLDWEARLKIAAGVAKGVAHIHQHGGGKLTHGNIKSSNVLLSVSNSPAVSDYGLAPLFGPAAAARVTGYRAPEVFMTRKSTHKSDVYSFGVLLLELLTGKSPTSTAADEGVDLPKWVQSVVREEWTAEVFDPELVKHAGNVEEEMLQILQVAMACVAETPEMRPTMAQVVKMLEDVKTFETDDGTTPSSESKDSTPAGPLHPPPTDSPTPAAAAAAAPTDSSSPGAGITP